MGNSTAKPDATPTTEQPDQDRTAGEPQEALVSMTQEALNSLIANEIRKERQKTQARYGDLDELLKLKENDEKRRQEEMSEIEKLQAQLASEKAEREKVQAQVKAEQLNTLRLRIGQEFGFPVEIAQRLTGEDEESIRADAENLKPLIGAESPPRAPNIDATAGGGQTSTGGVRLTPEEEQALKNAQRVDPNMTREKYIAAKQAMNKER